MTYFKDISTKTQLKTTYIKLAKQNHPDMGGNNHTMQNINAEYEFMNKLINTRKKSLMNLKKGDTVFVNGTECTVIFDTSKTFIAKAKDREKKEMFDKITGLGINNKKYKAYII